MFYNILKDVKIKDIQIQLIQTATMLIHNLSSDDCKSKIKLGYLLRTNFYREIVSYTFDFSDEEVVEIFMSMLKAFAITLKPETFSNFLSENGFSVLTGTMMFMNYHESMIKTAARTVILSTFTCKIHVVKPKNIKEYIVQSGFFSCFVSMMSDKLTMSDRYIFSLNANKLESSLAEISEDLYYIHDILEFQIAEFNELLTNLLIKNLFYPVVIASLGSIHKGSFHISIPLAAIFLHQTFRIVKNAELINSLVIGLLTKNIH